MKTVTKTIDKSRGRDYMRVTVEIREDDAQGLSNGFSITGELYEGGRRGADGRTRHKQGRDADVSGAMHDEIVMWFPELAPVVRVHLADLDGTPIHAKANGWYFYSGQATEYEREHYGTEYAERHGTPHQRAAKALHISADELPTGMTHDEFDKFADALENSWRVQAGEARALIESL